MKTIVLAAVTIDGKLARNPSHFVDWTSREDKKLFYQLTKRSGVMVIGDNTFKTFPGPLPGRLHVVLTYTPAGKENVPGVVEYTAAPPEAILSDLEARGYEEVVIGGGSQTNALFLEHDLVDEIWLTIEPLLFGIGVELFHGGTIGRPARLIHMERLNEAGSVHLRYSLRV
nr:RibD C-terminal domain protein [uncultured bacterium]